MTQKLAGRQPGVHEAYKGFLKLQSGPYLAHQEWLKDQPFQRSETVRFTLLSTRTNGIVKQADWLAALDETNKKLRRTGAAAPTREIFS